MVQVKQSKPRSYYYQDSRRPRDDRGLPKPDAVTTRQPRGEERERERERESSYLGRYSVDEAIHGNWGRVSW